MLTLDLGVIEVYDPTTGEFNTEHGGIVRFEYSLKAVYDWEGKWKKPFLNGGHTDEQWIDFYCKMALDPFKKEFLSEELLMLLKQYIEDPHTATVFRSNTDDGKASKSNEGKFQTSEEIYVAMISAQIPLEFEYRNLNRLITILRIMSLKGEKPKKMTKQEVLSQNASLNAQRKAMLKTKG